MQTLLDTLSLKKIPFSGRDFHIGQHRKYPPGQKVTAVTSDYTPPYFTCPVSVKVSYWVVV